MTFVSVLLPVYNGARYLDRAARSILNQTHEDLELLVLDDGSTDGSDRIAAALGDPRVRLIRNDRNRGLPATLNRGLREARAEIVARQDADDLSHPGRIERQVRFLDSNPEVGLVGTQAWVINEDGRCVGSVAHACRHPSLVWELAFDNAFVHTSVAFRRSVVAAVEGGYDEASGYNEDYDLWVKLARTTRLANLPERLVAWRSHGASKTRTTGDAATAANGRVLARSLPAVAGETSPETIELVARAQEGMEVRDLRLLIPLLQRWASSYRVSLDPQSLDDFRTTLARQYMTLAFTRRRRNAARVTLALWAGRHEGRALLGNLLALGAQSTRLSLGYDPLESFDVSRR